jgi:hypothetical protein
MTEQSNSNDTPTQAPAPQQPWGEQPPAKPSQVQYVVEKKSLEGLGGWLAFWMVVFAVAGLGYIGVFFSTLSLGINNPETTLLAIFSPIVAVCFIASVVTIAMRKKLGKWLSIISLGVVGVYNILNILIVPSQDVNDNTVAMKIGSAVTSLVFTGLFILYFIVSKRVKATLVN